ncbi:MAG: winged helix-turn-helix transcriptional regulator [Micavibrio aeruginosavorus]|uniref:Winged helix-turn-helix transcriptional regulator n=1 Tax=Micavibrio aeruginosavorus TaxID=349221 RepID=A0A7T5R4K5_9BACT|nr:MAG: winged helix-turn-helix transcriptional regulator [Micavibrio aeruginosavorus]
MMKNADKACDLLKSLAHPHRLGIVCRLIDGKASVGELAEFVGLRDSTVSQHLSLLRKDGIVTTRREGQIIWYSIKDDSARRLVELLHSIYCKNRKEGK